MRKLTAEENKAKETINHAISDYRTELEAITLVKDDVDMDPVMVGGFTLAGFYCHLMADPKKLAPTLLKYDYPVFAVLGEESPQAMWDELANTFGLASVDDFDL
jgi:hypothetical protein